MCLIINIFYLYRLKLDSDKDKSKNNPVIVQKQINYALQSGNKKKLIFK